MTDLEQLRADTPGCREVVHLNNAGGALPPRQVTDRVIEHLRLEQRIGGYEAEEAVQGDLAETYSSLASVINADASEIAITESATRSWLNVFTGLRLGPGDRILTTQAEYVSNAIALAEAERRYGVRIDQVPSTETGEVSVPALQSLLDDDVKVVCLTHAPTNGGLVQPLERIGAALAGSNAVFLVDACQSVGQLPVDVAAARIDALAATGRKFLRAPRGTGFLYVRSGVLDEITPVHVDHTSARLDGGRARFLPDARRFELFERNVAGVLGLGEAARYYLGVGTHAAAAAITTRATELRAMLRGTPGITVTDLGQEHSGIVSFRHDRIAPDDIAATLRGRKVNVSVSGAASTPWDMPARGLSGLVRASVHYYNDTEDLARFHEALRAAVG